MANDFSCHQNCGYLDRVPERLVLEGFRRWMQGCERGSFASWEMAANLFAEELGPVEGSRMLAELACWVDTVRNWMDRPAGLSPLGCPRLCRDECAALTMIAAAQSEDCDCLTTAVDLLVAPEGRAETMRATQVFAGALADMGKRLIPISAWVIQEIAERPTRSHFH